MHRSSDVVCVDARWHVAEAAAVSQGSQILVPKCVPSSYLSARLNAFACLVAGPGTRP